MNKRIRDLRGRKAEIVRKLTAMATASIDKPLTDDEKKEWAALEAQAAGLTEDIQREERLAALEVDVGANPAAATIPVGDQPAAADPKRGFKGFGEFAGAVMHAGRRDGGRLDPRLAAAPTTFGNESSGPDGGYLIPPEFARDIFTLAFAVPSIMGLVDDITVQGNGMVFPKDETTPWGTDGVVAYWQAEGTAGTPVKPKFGTSQMRLHKLMCLVPLTDELMADTTALESYLPGKIASRMRYKTDESLLYGAGNGTPLGMLYQGGNQYPSITVPKDSSQATATVSLANLLNMYSRLVAEDVDFGDPFWMMHRTIIPQLAALNTSGGFPVFMYAGGGVSSLGGQLPASVLGTRVMWSQHAKSLGAQGDINLIAPKAYRTITKAGGMETATSMHLYFDADALAYRVTFRIDGQPKITTAIAPANGSTTLSPFLVLAARP
jgi:HK97 family phage major capsid protein